jgi:hypothetical protein
LSRDEGKTFNFAKIYGAGIPSRAEQLNKSIKDAARLLEAV